MTTLSNSEYAILLKTLMQSSAYNSIPNLKSQLTEATNILKQSSKAKPTGCSISITGVNAQKLKELWEMFSLKDLM